MSLGRLDARRRFRAKLVDAPMSAWVRVGTCGFAPTNAGLLSLD
jgi:hypothetical protein